MDAAHRHAGAAAARGGGTGHRCGSRPGRLRGRHPAPSPSVSLRPGQVEGWVWARPVVAVREGCLGAVAASGAPRAGSSHSALASEVCRPSAAPLPVVGHAPCLLAGKQLLWMLNGVAGGAPLLQVASRLHSGIYWFCTVFFATGRVGSLKVGSGHGLV